MADKKITALTAATKADSDDLLHIVVQPDTSPVNKKLSVKDLFQNIKHETVESVATVTQSALDINHSVVPEASGSNKYNEVYSLSVNSDFTQAHSGGTAEVDNLIGGKFAVWIDDATVAVNQEATAIKAHLDVGQQHSSAAARTYGLTISTANTSAKAGPDTAFIKLEDCPHTGAYGGKETEYIMDIFPDGAYGEGTGGAGYGTGPIDITNTDFSSANPMGSLKVRVAGQVRYIQLFENKPSA